MEIYIFLAACLSVVVQAVTAFLIHETNLHHIGLKHFLDKRFKMLQPKDKTYAITGKELEELFPDEKKSNRHLRYAKVIDNFAKNDKGKEKYIGKIGKVIKIECDFYMFSQVLVKFKNGKKVWFSNTTLEEVDKEGNVIDGSKKT